MKKQANYIKRIEIKGIWGRKNIAWNLRPDVNILSGSVDPRNMTRSNRYVIHAASVFSGPQPGDYLPVGVVELGALVQYLNYKINGYALIEYSVSSTQRKRAYINANNLSESYTGLLSNFCNIAEGEIGEQDPSGNDMTKYGEWYGANGVSWCAIFVSWCAHPDSSTERSSPASKKGSGSKYHAKLV